MSQIIKEIHPLIYCFLFYCHGIRSCMKESRCCFIPELLPCGARPAQILRIRPLNSKTALQLLNIAVVRMKFAEISTICQPKGRQPHRTCRASAALITEQKPDRPSRPPQQRKRLQMKLRRVCAIIRQPFRNIFRLMLLRFVILVAFPVLLLCAFIFWD